MKLKVHSLEVKHIHASKINDDPHARSEKTDPPLLWAEGVLRVFGYVLDPEVNLGIYQSIELPYSEWKHLKLGEVVQITVQKVDE